MAGRIGRWLRRMKPSSEFGVSEFAAGSQGANSPFGEVLELPRPVTEIRYAHPAAEDRPHLPVDATQGR